MIGSCNFCGPVQFCDTKRMAEEKKEEIIIIENNNENGDKNYNRQGRGQGRNYENQSKPRTPKVSDLFLDVRGDSIENYQRELKDLKARNKNVDNINPKIGAKALHIAKDLQDRYANLTNRLESSNTSGTQQVEKYNSLLKEIEELKKVFAQLEKTIATVEEENTALRKLHEKENIPLPRVLTARQKEMEKLRKQKEREREQQIAANKQKKKEQKGEKKEEKEEKGEKKEEAKNEGEKKEGEEKKEGNDNAKNANNNNKKKNDNNPNANKQQAGGANKQANANANKKQGGANKQANNNKAAPKQPADK